MASLSLVLGHWSLVVRSGTGGWVTRSASQLPTDDQGPMTSDYLLGCPGGAPPGAAGGAGAAGFFELRYIWVKRWSGMWPPSIVTRVIRFLKKALKKIAGIEMAPPKRVTTRAWAMPSARADGFTWVALASTENDLIM